MIFICYPKCSTCQKAKKWLDENRIEYTERHIVEENPTYEELEGWYTRSGLPLKKFFNTSGMLYKEMQLKDKLPNMSEEEQLRLLATNGMLVKRPLIVGDDVILTGFKEKEWAEKLKEDIFSKAGFYGEYRDETIKFYKEYFATSKELYDFLTLVFQHDKFDKVPRRMMNQIVRWVTLANDIETIRPKKDALKIVCIRTCIEALAKLKEDCDNAGGKERGSKDSDKKTFFEHYLTDNDKQYIKNNFAVTMGDRKIVITEEIMKEFDSMIFCSCEIKK